MTYFVVMLAMGFFFGTLWYIGIVSAATHAINESQKAINIIWDSTKSDQEKEKILQRDALTLLQCFGSISIRGLLAFCVSVIPIIVFDFLNLANYSEVIDLLGRWETVLITTIFMSIVWVISRRFF